MSSTTGAERHVDVFADVSCPFAHVGLRRWVERRTAVGSQVGLHVMAWPLEMVNGHPLDGPHVAETVDRLRSRIAPDLFDGFDPRRFPVTTLPALRLTHSAYLVGIPVGEAIALELRDRLFERGEDISDPAVLASVADEHGVPAQPEPLPGEPDPVVEEWDLGRRRGVLGSPHYFAGDVNLFCPLLDITRAGDEVVISESDQRFERLCEASFAS